MTSRGRGERRERRARRDCWEREGGRHVRRGGAGGAPGGAGRGAAVAAGAAAACSCQRPLFGGRVGPVSSSREAPKVQRCPLSFSPSKSFSFRLPIADILLRPPPLLGLRGPRRLSERCAHQSLQHRAVSGGRRAGRGFPLPSSPFSSLPFLRQQKAAPAGCAPLTVPSPRSGVPAASRALSPRGAAARPAPPRGERAGPGLSEGAAWGRGAAGRCEMVEGRKEGRRGRRCPGCGSPCRALRRSFGILV